MELSAFEAKLKELERAVMTASRKYMEEAGHAFDERSFRDQASTDLDGFIRELFFFGADVFPTVPTESSVHPVEQQGNPDQG